MALNGVRRFHSVVAAHALACMAKVDHVEWEDLTEWWVARGALGQMHTWAGCGEAWSQSGPREFHSHSFGEKQFYLKLVQ